ncbi:MAG TPA: hypothetical protein H9935_06570 [Candidatus Blautia merdigallinarum]|uniref:Uncharacterized protein n=1 Tax=Candidatus Blautia merdigallinarum TaxID=2838495 RepID=A0A9D2N3W2_9FIRM|nr:hypothetical protein [Candidatus Blautia merdigallinarum]
METEKTGFSFWRGGLQVLRESWYLLLLSLRWFEPKVSNHARQIRIKDTKIPLKAAAAQKEKPPGELKECILKVIRNYKF